MRQSKGLHPCGVTLTPQNIEIDYHRIDSPASPRCEGLPRLFDGVAVEHAQNTCDKTVDKCDQDHDPNQNLALVGSPLQYAKQLITDGELACSVRGDAKDSPKVRVEHDVLYILRRNVYKMAIAF